MRKADIDEIVSTFHLGVQFSLTINAVVFTAVAILLHFANLHDFARIFIAGIFAPFVYIVPIMQSCVYLNRKIAGNNEMCLQVFGKVQDDARNKFTINNVIITVRGELLAFAVALAIYGVFYGTIVVMAGGALPESVNVALLSGAIFMRLYFQMVARHASVMTRRIVYATTGRDIDPADGKI
jgi:hypothetical protein